MRMLRDGNVIMLKRWISAGEIGVLLEGIGDMSFQRFSFMEANVKKLTEVAFNRWFCSSFEKK